MIFRRHTAESKTLPPRYFFVFLTETILGEALYVKRQHGTHIKVAEIDKVDFVFALREPLFKIRAHIERHAGAEALSSASILTSSFPISSAIFSPPF